MEEQIKDYLEKHKIKYVFHSHPAVFTCEEAEVHCKHVPGLACKNLFLKDKKSGKVYLVSVPAKKRVDLKALAAKLGEKHLSFGSAQRLKEYLNLEPGSVSPLGLLNDKKKEVIYIIDKKLWDVDIVNFHPNINTSSLEMKREDFRKYVDSLEQKVKIIEL
ncbi:prolyl-tRNA synthetase associated domain-containing protein [Candidatus Woesearchaeota archaeon]|nr:prolyl-tRNA synthetase associated domain-containing protein [Candidatus Woesearchaeota archaeon]